MALVLPFIRTSPWYLAFGLLIGFLNYRSTDRFRRMTGRSPWGIPPIVWALASVFISLFVTVLAFIAMSTSGRRRGRQGGGFPDGFPGRGGGMGTPGPYGNSASRQLHLPESAQPPIPATATQVIPPPPAASAPPSWHPDPSGRFDFRYWDGEQWTEYVSKDGESSQDPF
ncbi:MAG TPA: DUF2510 domain-containing protein [Acidimicrobiales bacterium]|jgi:hypothetical protein|nr:DUF2510 domain-containing protein [Acidimicrobiales bacterium]